MLKLHRTRAQILQLNEQNPTKLLLLCRKLVSFMTSQRETSGNITLVPEVFLDIFLREGKSKPQSGEVRWPIRVIHSTFFFS